MVGNGSGQTAVFRIKVIAHDDQTRTTGWQMKKVGDIFGHTRGQKSLTHFRAFLASLFFQQGDNEFVRSLKSLFVNVGIVRIHIDECGNNDLVVSVRRGSDITKAKFCCSYRQPQTMCCGFIECFDTATENMPRESVTEFVDGANA